MAEFGTEPGDPAELGVNLELRESPERARSSGSRPPAAGSARASAPSRAAAARCGSRLPGPRVRVRARGGRRRGGAAAAAADADATDAALAPFTPNARVAVADGVGEDFHVVGLGRRPTVRCATTAGACGSTCERAGAARASRRAPRRGGAEAPSSSRARSGDARVVAARRGAPRARARGLLDGVGFTASCLASSCGPVSANVPSRLSERSLSRRASSPPGFLAQFGIGADAAAPRAERRAHRRRAPAGAAVRAGVCQLRAQPRLAHGRDLRRLVARARRDAALRHQPVGDAVRAAARGRRPRRVRGKGGSLSSRRTFPR